MSSEEVLTLPIGENEAFQFDHGGTCALIPSTSTLFDRLTAYHIPARCKDVLMLAS